jgi:branched-chain amino acid transport system substrate-binding protein
MKAYRAAVGIDDNGAAVGDSKDVSTAAHMFGCWETLYVIKQAMEAAGYQGPADRVKLIEATEAIQGFDEGPEHPQGDKIFDGRLHQVYGHQNISKVEGGKLAVVHRTEIKDGMYEAEGDYTQQAL